MLRAARLGDGYMPYLFTPERYTESLQTINTIAREQKRDMSRFTPYNFVFTAVGRRAKRRAVLRSRSSQRYHQPFENLEPLLCAGHPARVC